MTQAAKWAVYGALFLIPILPLFVVGGLFFPYITGKAFAFRVLVEIALAGWLILACTDLRYRPRFSLTMLLFGAFTVWMFIADLVGVNPHKALWSNFERMDGWITLIHMFLFAVVASSVLTVHKLWRAWWFTFLTVSGIVCGYGLLQAAGVLETHQGNRVDASFGNAAYLPAYLLFCVAISLWQSLEQKGWLRYLLLALAGVQALVVLLSATRGAFLGLIGAIGIGGIIWLIDAKGAGRRIAVGALIALVVLAGGLFLSRSTAVVQESPILSRLASAFDVESLDVRFSIWNIALKGVAERPLTGWGQEGFNYVFATHYEPSLYEQEAWFDRAHNVFLDWLVAGGVPALLLFLAFLISVVASLYRPEFTRAERVMLIGALAAYAIQGLAVFDNLFSYVPLFAIVAFVHGRIGTPIGFFERAPLLTSEAKRSAAVSGITVLAVLTLWFVNVPALQAGGDLIKALNTPVSAAASTIPVFTRALAHNSFASQEIREYLVSYAAGIAQQPSVPDATKRELLVLAFSEMGKEIVEAPNDPRLRLQAATGYGAIGDFESAQKELTAALQLSPLKQTTLLQQGALYWQAGNHELARDAFNQAYALDTSFTTLAAYAASGEIVSGNPEAGKALLIQTFGTTTVDSDPLRVAYYETKQYDELIAIERGRVAAANGSAKSRFALAVLYQAVGRTADAEAEVRATVKVYPASAAEGAALIEQFKQGVK